MMDPIGLGLSVLGLAGLFSTAVECFEYVQLGRNFGRDFQTTQLRLDIARLKLSRWGKSVGLSDEADNDQRQVDDQADHFVDAPEDVDKAKAKEILVSIIRLFGDAENISKKYKEKQGPNSTSLQVNDPQRNLDSQGVILHNKTNKMSVSRLNNKCTLKRKVKWALYEGKAFKTLIDEVDILVSVLVEEFSSARERYSELCKQDVAAIGTEEVLELLKGIAANQDKELEAAITMALEDRKPIVQFGNNNSGFQLGYSSGTITLSGVTFGKTA